HRKEVVPPAADAAAMLLDQLAEGNAHRFLDHAGFFHMAADLEQLGTLVVLAPEAREPCPAAPQYGRHHRDRFHIVDRGRAAIETRARGEWRLEPRLALLAFKALDHRGFFAADIGACTAVDEDVEIIARA